MRRVNGNSIIAFTDIEFPVSIVGIAYSTDTATIERRPFAKQAAGVKLLASVVPATAIWINYELDGPQDVFLVGKLHAHKLNSALAFDPDIIRGIDHNFGYLGVTEQFLD